MTNSTGAWRSNRFEVFDPEDFAFWCSGLGIECRDQPDGRVMLYSDADGGCFPIGPWHALDGQTYEGGSDEFVALIGQHLVPEPDNVCVIMQVINERPSLMLGEAWAVRAPQLGEPSFVQITLTEILDRAKSAFGLSEEPDPASPPWW